MQPNHTQIFDVTIVAMILNIVNTATNLFWSFRVKGAQADSEIFKTLKEANTEKDTLITELKADLKESREERNRYRSQYHSILAKFNILQGQVKTYTEFHGHEPPIKSS